MATRQNNRVILLTCVHGRMPVVRFCINQSPRIDRAVVCSTDEEVKSLKQMGCKYVYKHQNLPLSEKWQYGLKKLKRIAFDRVILMGSDDFFDRAFLNYIESQPMNIDLIAFEDLYFVDKHNKHYYWPGYQDQRKGEPAGAGKAYTKKYLERIGYSLFPVARNKGLDGQSWVVVNQYNTKMKITTLRENSLMLCDFKDGQGVTPLTSIKGIKRIN